MGCKSFLIYKDMLKIFATTRSECTVKQKNKARYNTDYDLAMTEKRSRHLFKKVIFIYIC